MDKLGTHRGYVIWQFPDGHCEGWKTIKPKMIKHNGRVEQVGADIKRIVTTGHSWEEATAQINRKLDHGSSRKRKSRSSNDQGELPLNFD